MTPIVGISLIFCLISPFTLFISFTLWKQKLFFLKNRSNNSHSTTAFERGSPFSRHSSAAKFFLESIFLPFHSFFIYKEIYPFKTTSSKTTENRATVPQLTPFSLPLSIFLLPPLPFPYLTLLAADYPLIVSSFLFPFFPKLIPKNCNCARV